MPQEFQVLRCVNCEKFQVHQTKKAKKWICKVCGEKQSYLRIYFTGSAPQCRSIVQENNFKAGERKTARMLAESPNWFQEDGDIEEEFDDEQNSNDHFSKKMKFETEYFNIGSTEDENSFFVKSCDEADEPFNQNDFTETLVKKLDSAQKQSLTTAKLNAKDLVLNTVSNSCDKTEICSKSEAPKVKPHFVKNKGFQKILRAAEKFS